MFERPASGAKSATGMGRTGRLYGVNVLPQQLPNSLVQMRLMLSVYRMGAVTQQLVVGLRSMCMLVCGRGPELKGRSRRSVSLPNLEVPSGASLQGSWLASSQCYSQTIVNVQQRI
jgi:hypothetical protein